ncbi:DNA-3-methyladenine glycosidase II [Roseibium sp. TrichSKD4]|uniref:DNA-3-methyladenine glycosylase family protein n=1 Tax=Roseibium sp. TrichSKD4 TaxID=744980 RepID=UPI0001E56C1D|nr:DNA-3-methyladenine glycosylase [Roseibium sp. TrichSKD4]EFO32658.1 DNA-3-methyladenine glycosidase II [Roseibium sp. TrichSKD4]
MQIISSLEDISFAMAELRGLDPKLRPVMESAGNIPLRRRPPDFAGLAQIVTGQLVSVAAAAAIFQRLEAAVSPLTAKEIDNTPDEVLKSAGLSMPKIRTLRAITEECRRGLDLAALAAAPAEDAHKRLCAIKGIGRWTADIFLLFCAGHPDIFPGGDLALQTAARDAFGLPDRPGVKEMDALASQWAPWRSVAARVLWAWYKTQKNGKATMPL